ncbi:MAG: hypothetical protein ACOCXA_04065, partial [Planctomycetota bacterium]
ELGKPSDTDPGADHWPRNLVNGFTSDDNWAFCYTIIMDRGDSRRIELTLPKEEEIVALKIRPSKIYHPITTMNIYFDDDPEPVVAEIPVLEQPQTEEIPVQGRRARRVTLEVAEWAERGTKNIVVIDNIALQVARDEDYLADTSSLLNIGALMKYRRGAGGIVLNQVNVLPRERNPENIEKKRSIVKTLLANMGAVFGGGKTTIAGENLRYAPVRIPDSAFNAYVHRNGEPRWFRGRGDLAAIPVGMQTFADVSYHLSDFSTSPVPSVLMLAGKGSETTDEQLRIAVDTTADALFFLHTAQEEKGAKQWQREVDRAAARAKRHAPPPPEAFRYRIVYGNGEQVVVPVVWNEGIGPWSTRAPGDLKAAALAWSLQPDEKRPDHVAVYGMKWTNPRPDQPIVEVVMEYGEDADVATPALFGITAARVQE